MDGMVCTKTQDTFSVSVWPCEGKSLRQMLVHTSLGFSLNVRLDGKVYSRSKGRTIPVWCPDDGMLFETHEGRSDVIWTFTMGIDGDAFKSVGGHDRPSPSHQHCAGPSLLLSETDVSLLSPTAPTYAAIDEHRCVDATPEPDPTSTPTFKSLRVGDGSGGTRRVLYEGTVREWVREVGTKLQSLKKRDRDRDGPALALAVGRDGSLFVAGVPSTTKSIDTVLIW